MLPNVLGKRWGEGRKRVGGSGGGMNTGDHPQQGCLSLLTLPILIPRGSNRAEARQSVSMVNTLSRGSD